MKFFIDTANIKQIAEVNELGLLDGVTTNPTLIAKEGGKFKETIQDICKLLGDRPVSAEVIAPDAPGMLAEAREVASWASNVVIKVPLTPAGITAASQLSKERIRTNVTLVFSAAQAILAAKVGATFVSPFVGRLDDIAHDGMQLVSDTAEILLRYGYKSEIIAASIRGPLHVVDAAMAGAHIATLPHSVLMSLFKHPLTDIGNKRFLEDWNKAGLPPIL
jgi:transaldolase